MKSVFVDTSGFYAFLDRDDRFHAEAKRLFLQAESEGWSLLTSNYVVHESWALIQARLGWEAVGDALQGSTQIAFFNPQHSWNPNYQPSLVHYDK